MQDSLSRISAGHGPFTELKSHSFDKKQFKMTNKQQDMCYTTMYRIQTELSARIQSSVQSDEIIATASVITATGLTIKFPFRVDYKVEQKTFIKTLALELNTSTRLVLLN